MMKLVFVCKPIIFVYLFICMFVHVYAQGLFSLLHWNKNSSSSSS